MCAESKLDDTNARLAETTLLDVVGKQPGELMVWDAAESALQRAAISGEDLRRAIWRLLGNGSLVLAPGMRLAVSEIQDACQEDAVSRQCSTVAAS